MILLQSPSRYLLQILSTRLHNLDKGVELDCHWVEFDDVRYHVQASVKNPHLLLLSVSLPTPPPETVFQGGLPLGAIEAVKAAYGVAVQILDPPRDGFNLTVKMNFSKLPPTEEGSVTIFAALHRISILEGACTRKMKVHRIGKAIAGQFRFVANYVAEELGRLWVTLESEKANWQYTKDSQNATYKARTVSLWNLVLRCFPSNASSNRYAADYRQALLLKVASVREVVLGAPLRVFLKHLASRSVAPETDMLVALVHRPKESFFLVPQAEKVTVVFPLRFNDSTDTVLATSFLQEFVEARRSAGLNSAPPCSWSPSPPLELKGAPLEALSANAGFVTFGNACVCRLFIHFLPFTQLLIKRTINAVIFPRHVEGKKLDRTVWSLSTFHAYVSYHVKCSEGFMHTRMRRRVESLIQVISSFCLVF
ncbi:hypothetical protein RJ639_044400, partial [Escallonia herrerae]